MKKLILITLICIISYISGYWMCSQKYNFKTQAEMIHASYQDLSQIDSKFESICDNIIQNFSLDKQFISNFKTDKEEFLKYRETQVNTILPQGAIFSNYPIYANSYKQELTANKILEYKKAVKTYCLYNGTQSENACSDETIEKLFK